MADKKTKLELTWIGKENRPRLEPRILLEDPALSYSAKQRVTENDIFDNLLIHGDNLLALKALEQEYTGKVKCIFIDPPYNTGSAFEHYDDGLEHSVWLSLMRHRLETLRTLLSAEGSIWVSIDDNEVHYLKVMMDEVFGRACFVSSVVWRSTDNSNNDAKQFSVDHNYVLVYGKQPGWRPNRVHDDSKRSHFRNPDNDPKGPWFDGNPLNSPKPRPNLTYDLVAPNGQIIAPPANGWRWGRETMQEKIASGEIRFSHDGKRINRRTYLRDMAGLPPSTLWSDLDATGHNRQAKYELKGIFEDRSTSELFSTPKPERLISFILEISTSSGDLVLDSFLGSGTTAAVAHKMRRRWIGIELGDHAVTFCVPRLKKVIDGKDPGGITDAAGWTSGGGFRFCRLAPSMLQKDKWDNWVINPAYNKEMLAEAMCKLQGFHYAPSPSVFWMHGQSTERDFIYVTTQHLTHGQLEVMSAEVGSERSLLICCSSFDPKPDAFDNLTLQKIPASVLARCEWGKDDYSLNVQSVLGQDPDPPPEPAAGGPHAASASAATPKGKRGRRVPVQSLSLPLFGASASDASEPEGEK